MRVVPVKHHSSVMVEEEEERCHVPESKVISFHLHHTSQQRYGAYPGFTRPPGIEMKNDVFNQTSYRSRGNRIRSMDYGLGVCNGPKDWKSK